MAFALSLTLALPLPAFTGLAAAGLSFGLLAFRGLTGLRRLTAGLPAGRLRVPGGLFGHAVLRLVPLTRLRRFACRLTGLRLAAGRVALALLRLPRTSLAGLRLAGLFLAGLTRLRLRVTLGS